MIIIVSSEAAKSNLLTRLIWAIMKDKDIRIEATATTGVRFDVGDGAGWSPLSDPMCDICAGHGLSSGPGFYCDQHNIYLTDSERLRRAEVRYAEIGSGSELTSSQLAEQINRDTGVGIDAARLVVMARAARREGSR